MPYNVDAARQAGLSDEEIATHLASTRNYKLADALKAGVTHKEIIDFLAPQKSAAPRPTPAEIVPKAVVEKPSISPTQERPPMAIAPPGLINPNLMRPPERPKPYPAAPEPSDQIKEPPTPSSIDLSGFPKEELIPSHEPVKPLLGPPVAEGEQVKPSDQVMVEALTGKKEITPAEPPTGLEAEQANLQSMAAISKEEAPRKRKPFIPVPVTVTSPLAARHPYLAAIPPTLWETAKAVIPFGKYAGEEGRKELKGEFFPTGTTTDPEKLKEIEKELVTGEKRVSPYESLAKETMSAAEWAAFPTAMRTVGAIAKEVLPKAVIRAFTTPIGAWLKSLTNKDRRLMIQSIPDMLSKGYSEGEVLRRWNNPSWREEALRRRNKGEEYPPFAEAGKPTEPSPPVAPPGITPQPQEPVGSMIPGPGTPAPQSKTISGPRPAVETPEPIGTTMPMGISSIAPPPRLGPTVEPIQGPTPQPIPQMMGMGQEMPMPLPEERVPTFEEAVAKSDAKTAEMKRIAERFAQSQKATSETPPEATAQSIAEIPPVLEKPPILPPSEPQISPRGEEPLRRGLSYEEWSKDPALVEDAKAVAAENGVKPESLEYLGVQSFRPNSTDAMHLWNVTDPNSPKFKSTVAGPKFQQESTLEEGTNIPPVTQMHEMPVGTSVKVNGREGVVNEVNPDGTISVGFEGGGMADVRPEEITVTETLAGQGASKEALPVSEEEVKPGPLRPETVGIEPAKEKAKTLNTPEGWTTAIQPTWRKTPGWQAEVDWKGKRIVFETEADSKNVDIVNHEIGHIRLEDKLGDVQKLSDSPLLQTYAKIRKEPKDTHINFIREHLAMDYGQYLTDPEKVTPELKALFEEYFPEGEAKQHPEKKATSVAAPTASQLPPELKNLGYDDRQIARMRPDVAKEIMDRRLNADQVSITQDGYLVYITGKTKGLESAKEVTPSEKVPTPTQMREVSKTEEGNWQKGESRPFAFDPNSTENEGRFRLYPPEDIKKGTYKSQSAIKSKSIEPTEGVRFILGDTKDGERVIQTIRFDKSVMPEDKAAQWWTENEDRFKFSAPRGKEEPISIEPTLPPGVVATPQEPIKRVAQTTPPGIPTIRAEKTEVTTPVQVVPPILPIGQQVQIAEPTPAPETRIEEPVFPITNETFKELDKPFTEFDLNIIPEKMVIKVQAIREETGKPIEIYENARTAVMEHREKVNQFKSLLDCIRA